MKIVHNTLSYNYLDHDGEVNNLPSETIPDETMSIREILDRYARGLPLNGMRTPLYQREPSFDDLPDPATMDLAERQELAEMLEAELEDLREKQIRYRVSEEERQKAAAAAPPEASSDEVAKDKLTLKTSPSETKMQ